MAMTTKKQAICRPQHALIRDPEAGRLLWLSDGVTELKVSLDYGPRILHLSCVDMENLFYAQPADLSDGLATPEGWRLRGGHRLWAAPEGDLSYYPDNEPVAWELLEDGVRLTQPVDPWLQIRKRIELHYEPDGAILVLQSIENAGTQPASLASWGVNTFAGGGYAEAEFEGSEPGSFRPGRFLSLWGQTSLADPRITLKQNRVCAQHLPRQEYFKIGLYSHSGRATLWNRRQRLELSFGADAFGRYPDGGCNFELFLDPNIMELEALGPLCTLAPGEQACHWERWRVSPCGDAK